MEKVNRIKILPLRIFSDSRIARMYTNHRTFRNCLPFHFHFLVLPRRHEKNNAIPITGIEVSLKPPRRWTDIAFALCSMEVRPGIPPAVRSSQITICGGRIAQRCTVAHLPSADVAGAAVYTRRAYTSLASIQLPFEVGDLANDI